MLYIEDIYEYKKSENKNLYLCVYANIPWKDTFDISS